jgi:hypothetical protein
MRFYLWRLGPGVALVAGLVVLDACLCSRCVVRGAWVTEARRCEAVACLSIVVEFQRAPDEQQVGTKKMVRSAMRTLQGLLKLPYTVSHLADLGVKLLCGGEDETVLCLEDLNGPRRTSRHTVSPSRRPGRLV